jgi:hypothetical protein
MSSHTHRNSPPADGGTPYTFAILRAVPHVYLGAFVPVGIVLFAPTHPFLGMRVITDEQILAHHVPDVDTALLARYLRTYEEISAGDQIAGPIALGTQSERFHWLTAPRSDVIQSGPVHEGVCDHPAKALEELFFKYVWVKGATRG